MSTKKETYKSAKSRKRHESTESMSERRKEYGMKKPKRKGGRGR